jgi:hypothetical protein
MEENRPYTADELKRMAGKEEKASQDSPKDPKEMYRDQQRIKEELGQGEEKVEKERVEEAARNPTNTTEAAQPSQTDIPYDIIELPSQGLFYPSGKDKVSVGYMMLQDENLLNTPNLMQDGKALDILLDRKILDKDISKDDLLTGDRDEILLFLRSTGLGSEYTFQMTDPQTNKPFDYTVDLTTLERNKPDSPPDSDFCYTFTLPNSQKKVRYTFLTVREENNLIKQDEDRQGYYQESKLMTMRLARQIREIDGITDRGKIESIIEYMPLIESRKLRAEMNKNQPNIDFTITVESPSGQVFKTQMPITEEFFFPRL